MKRKILSILLVLSMALTLLPTAVLAEGGTVATVEGEEYATFSAAFDAAKEVAKTSEIHSATVILLKDVELDTDITLDGNDNVENENPLDININLGNFTLDMKDKVIKLENGAVIEIFDGYIKSNPEESTIAAFTVNANSALLVENVEMETSGAAFYGRGDCAMISVINSQITAGTYAITTNAAKSDNYNPAFSIQESTLRGSSPVLVNVPCELKIEDSKIEGSMHGVVVRGGTAEIKGGAITQTYTGDNYQAMAEYFDNREWGTGNTLNLGALIVGNKNATSYQYSSEVTVTNTIIQTDGDHADSFPAIYTYANSGEDKGVSLEIGGDETLVTGKIVKGNEDNNSISISGGTFSADPSDYVANGYAAKKVDDSTWMVGEKEYVAQIGDTKYDTLAAAVAAVPVADASNGETPVQTEIKLLKDTNGGFDFGKTTSGTKAVNAVLDLNGKTLTLGPALGSKGTETNGLRVLAYSTLEIKNGKITNSDIENNEGKKVAILLVNYSDLKLTDVTVEPLAQASLAINNRGNLTLCGKTDVKNPTTVNGFSGWPTGTPIAVTNDPYNYFYTNKNATVNVADSNVKVGNVMAELYGNNTNSGTVEFNISGGSFGAFYNDGSTKRAVIGNLTGGIYDADPTAYLAAGYCVKEAGNAFEVGEHSLTKTEAKEATCTEQGNSAYYTCENCSKVYKDAEGEKLTTVAEVTIQAKGHTMTKTEAKAATCKETGNAAYYTCGVCNKVYEDEQGNTPTTVEQTVTEIDQTNHQYKTQVVAKASTCTEKGWDAYETCECGAILVNGSEVEHIPYKEKTAHSWDNGVVTTEPTESSKGVKTFTCTVCKETRTEDIPELGHQHHWTLVAGTSATCTAAGVVEHYKCDGCSAEASYSAETKVYTIADDTSIFVIAKKDHTEVIDAAVEATCTEAGKTEGKHCSVCKAVLVAQAEIPALGHDYKNGECTRCHAKETVEEETDLSYAMVNNELVIRLKCKLPAATGEYRFEFVSESMTMGVDLSDYDGSDYSIAGLFSGFKGQGTTTYTSLKLQDKQGDSKTDLLTTDKELTVQYDVGEAVAIKELVNEKNDNGKWKVFIKLDGEFDENDRFAVYAYTLTSDGERNIAWTDEVTNLEDGRLETSRVLDSNRNGVMFDVLKVTGAVGIDGNATLTFTPRGEGKQWTAPADSGNTGGNTGGSTSGGSSSGSTTTKTETTTNPDGSTTKTETKADGTTVETTTNIDGSTTTTETKTETKADGSTVETKKETSTAADGTQTETEAKTETKADGTTTSTETSKTTDVNGSTGTTTTTNENGNTKTEAEAKISEKAVEDAKQSGEAVKVPTEVKAGESSNSAPTVKIELPENAGETKVEIPVSNVNSGTVAVIVHEDGTEEIVKDSTVTENGVVLGVEGNTTVKIIDNSKTFIDTENHWSRDEVNFVASRELFNGIGNNLFGVSGDMTRGMVNTVLARLAGEDTNGGANWYDKGTEWAKKNGITDGTNPTANVTREQLAAMLYRFAGSPEVSGELSFADADQISGYAKDALLWAVQNGILNGIGNNLVAPTAGAERAQVAAMMARYLKNVG